MKVAKGQCAECGQALGEAGKPKLFCSSVCRQAFNNRRMQRGAMLYDLFMTMRYERGRAKVLGIWAIVCRMAMEWRREDDAKRGGRKSWQRAGSVLDRLPLTTVSSDVTILYDRTGKSGARRPAIDRAA
jgi:hypothetical protein